MQKRDAIRDFIVFAIVWLLTVSIIALLVLAATRADDRRLDECRRNGTTGSVWVASGKGGAYRAEVCADDADRDA